MASRRQESSTASSAAAHHQVIRDNVVPFERIGFGQCGLVFEQAGRGYAIKVAKKGYADALWTDVVAHLNIYESFEKHHPECQVPRVYQYVTDSNKDWWDENLQHFNTNQQGHDFHLPAMALISQRIFPLPKVVRTALIEKFCPQNLKTSALANKTNRDCLARIYLGKRRQTNSPPSPNFTLRNFNLHLDQMLEMGMPVLDFSRAIGQALAIIHWSAKVDGYDIEFVLGSQPDTVFLHGGPPRLTGAMLRTLPPHTKLDNLMQCDFASRMTRMWVLDFNLCTIYDDTVMKEHHEELIQQLVFSFSKMIHTTHFRCMTVHWKNNCGKGSAAHI
ncbi:zinc finger protein-domain-containing protein [Paramyrothecium foliicola]|nr:zinc finger protein-domain-containing protein [Paramyrothecium foliicola]